jgi:hypothetical protein
MFLVSRNHEKKQAGMCHVDQELNRFHPLGPHSGSMAAVVHGNVV